MRRLLSSVAALAFVLALGTGTALATDKTGSPAMGGTSMGMTCPKGSSWVKGYTNKAGKVVKGYCRKGKSKPKMM